MPRHLLTFVVSSIAVLMSVSGAQAAPPERFHESDSGSELGFATCDGFEIDLETTGTEDVTVFFNSAGEVEKVIVRARARDVLTNTVTGKTVVNRGVFQQVFTRSDGTDEFTHSLVGYRYMATSPGEGVVLQDTGRIEYSPDEEEVTFIAGHHFDIPGGPDGGALFCAALS